MSMWWPGEWDRVISKVEDWILKKNGYSKLQPHRLSRGYQGLMTKPKSDMVCTTFRFPVADTDNQDENSQGKNFSFIKRLSPQQDFSSEKINYDTMQMETIEHCVHSLDKMEKILKQYERAFAKLQKRGPDCSTHIRNQNIDILNEDVIENSDTRKMDEVEDNYFQNESELDDMEHTFRSLAANLNSTESKLKETQLQLQAITLTKLELERILESERRKSAGVQAQLKLMQTTMQQWEQERSSFRETSIKQGIQLESMTNEKNSLSETIKKLQNENFELKMKADMNEKEVIGQKTLKNIIQGHKSSMNSIFENIFVQNRKLESEQNSLQKSVEISVSLGQHMIQLLKLHHKILNETLAENDTLKHNNNLLSSELESPKEKNNIKNSNLRNNNGCNNEEKDTDIKNHLKNCEFIISSVDTRINKEFEERKKLNELLKKTLDEQITFFETEKKLKDHITDLEKAVILHKNVDKEVGE